jgi:hypothetical protein
MCAADSCHSFPEATRHEPLRRTLPGPVRGTGTQTATECGSAAGCWLDAEPSLNRRPDAARILLEQGCRGVTGCLGEPAGPESQPLVVGVKRSVGGPYIHADPAGPVALPGAKPSPVQQCSAEAPSREGPADNQAACIHRWIAPRLGRPDRVFCRISCDRGGRCAAFPADPGLPGDQVLADPVIAVLLARPGLCPLIGVLGPQPVGRRVNQVDDDFVITQGGTMKRKR